MNTASLHSRAAAPTTRQHSLISDLLPLVQDLTTHRAWIYWSDLAFSTGLFWGGLYALSSKSWLPAWLQLAVAVVATLALYRAAIFMHEIVHVPRRKMPGFMLAWNLACGIPLMLPSFMYQSHLDHHSARHYGTGQDPEYLPFARSPLASWLILIAGALLTPVLLFARFALLAPASLLSPALRAWLDRHLSSVVLHFRYVRPEAGPKQAREQRWQEAGATLFVWLMLWLLANGLLSARVLLFYAGMVLSTLLINAIRTRFAHHYRLDGQPVSHAEQLADSVNHHAAGRWLTLLEPVGMRFHALHHLFPFLPYHSLAEAHRRLMNAPGEAARFYREVCLSPTQRQVADLAFEKRIAP
ncbi:hypothetical protein BI347_08165 [Chromobacterium sphagni]|uniref:Fatty acid desaturase domain-containing protein n=1 Tax=Chromobacterium sphagni TaxID=1903179 RepID=A0A1S1X230_9NEIS|nr:fatty acid desaturase [Chromobacterium sphagni]OHX13489.1 hypothetical protein BI347_08165 [Chromobacterium sphagni]